MLCKQMYIATSARRVLLRKHQTFEGALAAKVTFFSHVLFSHWLQRQFWVSACAVFPRITKWYGNPVVGELCEKYNEGYGWDLWGVGRHVQNHPALCQGLGEDRLNACQMDQGLWGEECCSVFFGGSSATPYFLGGPWRGWTPWLGWLLSER